MTPEAALRRAVRRHRSALVLLGRGHDEDALLLLAALVDDLRALAGAAPRALAARPEAAEILDQAAALLAGTEPPGPAAARRCAALCLRATFALDAAWRRARPADPRRARRLAAFSAVLVLAFALVAGGGRFFAWRLDASRRREATKSVIELANLAGEAKKRGRTTLLALTGNSCSECVCKTGRPLRDLPAGDICMTNWIKALTAIAETATGQPARDVLGRLVLPERLARDPWGSPYLLNENEGEEPGTCEPDVLRSAGPDGLPGTADDIVAAIPPVWCP